jgi:hypothetical protein
LFQNNHSQISLDFGAFYSRRRSDRPFSRAFCGFLGGVFAEAIVNRGDGVGQGVERKEPEWHVSLVRFALLSARYPGSPARQAGPAGFHPRLSHGFFGQQISLFPRFFYPCRVFSHRLIEGSKTFLSSTARRMRSFNLQIADGMASAAELRLYMFISIVYKPAPCQENS